MESPTLIPAIESNGALNQQDVIFLADAFSEFISASARLESSYGQLQLEVAQLSSELAERNAALNASLAENERVHSALQQIVDSMPCGVLVIGGYDSISMINAEGKRLLGWSASVHAGLKVISRESGVDLHGFLKRDSRAEDEQEFSRTLPGGKRWLSVHEKRLSHGKEQGGQSGQTILILRDVTLHKQAEQERERTRKALALSEVATTLAHEIRNPLASLELFAGLIAQGGEDTAEWVSHLHAGIRSLSGTVNNVLSFHGGGTPAMTRLNLCEAIRSSVGFVRPIADQAGVRLVFEAHSDALEVMGNVSALQQLVLNLVGNSIRHTNANGVVTVTLQRLFIAQRLQSGRALVEFSDTGTGIAPEHVKEIFRAGFSGSGNSSGLGLAVCQQIVNQHDGSIRVASEVGKGTTFFVEIPTV